MSQNTEAAKSFVWKLEHNQVIHLALIVVGAFLLSWFLRFLHRTLTSVFKNTKHLGFFFH